MRTDWTAPALVRALRESYPHHSVAETARRLNVRFGLSLTLPAVKWGAKKHGLRQRRETLSRVRRVPRLLTAAQDALFRQLYLDMSCRACAEALNQRFGLDLSVRQLRNYASNHKIRCRRRVNAGQFRAGNRDRPYRIPKGAHISPATEFKKGDVPANIKPLGDIHFDARTGAPLIKIAERNPYTGHATRYYSLARYTWQQAHGPIPPGGVITHLDGDMYNNDIANLTLIGRSALAALNNPRVVPPYRCARSNPTRIALARLVVALSRAQARVGR